MKLGWLVLIAATHGVAAAEVKGLQDPANPIEPAPPPPPSPPDPIVQQSGMHGVESTARHQGYHVTLAVGGGLSVGIGLDNSIGRGPSASLRLGRMAGERLAFTVELANITLLRKAGSDGPTRTDLGNNFLIGTQLYVNRTLWLRLGVGVGSFIVDNGSMMDKPIFSGPSGVAGGGLDLIRFRRAAIGFEVMSLGMIVNHGLLTNTAFMLDVSIE